MSSLFGLDIDSTLDVAATAVAAVLFLVARLFLPKEERSRARIAAVYWLLSLLFGALSAVVESRSSVRQMVLFCHYFFVFASCGRSAVLLAVDVVFGRRTHRAPPRIFRDLTQAVVYVIVVLVTFRVIGIEPGSILTTSAILTAVVGLALQDTLGNLVSGLALQLQRPFQVGDWIQFDPDERQIGQVTEVNWRATKVMTSDLVELNVPNGVLARSSIRNYTQPSPVSRRSISLHAPYEVPPRRVHEAILGAIAGAPGVLSDPAPWVQTRTFADSGIEYMVWFFTNDFAGRQRTDSAVRDRIWYALQRHGIAMPFPIRSVHLHQVSEQSLKRDHERELERRDRALRCVDLFDVLPPESHRALAASAVKKLYAPGEIIVRQGEQSTELFLIDRGEVSVELVQGDRAFPVAQLGAGRFFGEMALMTGEVRKATVRAMGECELLVIDHEAFQQTLASAPDVVEKVSELLARRQAELEAVASEKSTVEEPIQERSRRLISQIKTFFRI